MGGGRAERLEIESNGLIFDARAAGLPDGRPVVLLHGFPQSSASWEPLLGVLGAAGFRAVAPDQRGYSPRARPTAVDAYRLDELVGDVLGIATAVRAWAGPLAGTPRGVAQGRVDLVGHDWGGLVAWVLAARHPERVRSLVVVSTPHPRAMAAALASGEADQASRAASIQALARSADPERLLLDKDGSGLSSMLEGSGLPPSPAATYTAAMSEPGALAAALNWYRALDPAQLADLPPVVVPTLYVWSTGDAALGRAPAERTAEWVAGRYRFVALDAVSHWIPEEAPDELGRLVLEHLRST